jgi:hypothetical protein
MKTNDWGLGSVWRRWDPHIHTPATALANNFSSDWDKFFDAIEKASPAVEALGITDYVTIRGYQEFRRRLPKGKLPGVRLAFPNIEFRVNPNTPKNKGINIHVLVSPHDPNHERLILDALSRLSFPIDGQPYSATESGLRDLGRAHNKALRGTEEDAEAAFREGVNQFKPSFETLRTWWEGEKWLKRNSLIAVSPKSSDGTAGLACDDGFALVRKDIQRFAHVILSANPADRDYWLGAGPDSEGDLRQEYGGLKPCLHGCDAHSVEKVLAPELNRFCWIKAETTFEGLRQVVFEPRERVYLGERPPGRPSPNAISRLSALSVGNADAIFDLNPGLVAVIGEKGSGKTAFADLVAKAAGARPAGQGSFILKAQEHLSNSETWVNWSDGEQTGGPVLADQDHFGSDPPPPRVRYLSQHFVEQLCVGDDGEELSDQLVREIESVVFEYLDPSDRLSASTFGELRETRCRPFQERRSELTTVISEQCTVVEAEGEAFDGLPKRRARVLEVTKEIERLKAEQRLLTPQGQASAAKQKEYEGQLARLAKTDDRLRVLKERQQAIVRIRAKMARLKDDIASFDVALRNALLTSGLASEQSIQALAKSFLPEIPAAADAYLKSNDISISAEIVQLESSPTPNASGLESRSVLVSRTDGLKKTLLADETKQKRATELQRLVTTKQAEYHRLSNEVTRVESTYHGHVAAAKERRRDSYAGIFDQFALEEKALESLYAPLERHLSAGGDAERRLTFSVKRHVDLRDWAERGELLLDLRHSGPAKGSGGLFAMADKTLAKAWRQGVGREAQAAIEQLLKELLANGIQKQLAASTTPRMFADWFFSTEHIQLRYGLKYDGTDLHLLSPGTRGIVLLILYLAIDVGDDRPLIIDQPEENLDPRSVYQVLGQYFREAKQRRQVLLVTHNANLVINTDADQVIVASATRNAGCLPSFSYFAGALEDATVRRNVCDLLEGGERAFREREQRYFPGGNRLDR